MKRAGLIALGGWVMVFAVACSEDDLGVRGLTLMDVLEVLDAETGADGVEAVEDAAPETGVQADPDAASPEDAPETPGETDAVDDASSNDATTCSGTTCTAGAVYCPAPGVEQRCEADPATGCLAPGLALICASGDPCRVDTCVPGIGCVAQERTCDDDDVCTADDCDPELGCVNVPNTACEDDSPCTVGLCHPIAGCIQSPLAAVCDDGDPCSLGDVCTGGVCVPALILDCDDDRPCTIDACTGSGCSHVAAAGECDDGDACTALDACVAGQCVPGQAPDCDDGDGCTIDSCHSGKGCVFAPIPPCADGDACTAKDACTAGACEGQPVSCDDQDLCTTDSCDPATGCRHIAVVCSEPESACHTVACEPEQGCTERSIDCSDGNPCTLDACGDDGCQHDVIHDKPCDDGTSCTKQDICIEGECFGTPLDCNDKNPCTEDLCTETNGCMNVSTCDDGNPCTEDTCNIYKGCESAYGEVCTNGVCFAVQGAPQCCPLNHVLANGTCVAGETGPTQPHLLVSDGSTSRVFAVDFDGNVLLEVEIPLGKLRGIAHDPGAGSGFWVASDDSTKRLHKVDWNGNIVTSYELWNPKDIWHIYGIDVRFDSGILTVAFVCEADEYGRMMVRLGDNVGFAMYLEQGAAWGIHLIAGSPYMSAVEYWLTASGTLDWFKKESPWSVPDVVSTNQTPVPGDDLRGMTVLPDGTIWYVDAGANLLRHVDAEGNELGGILAPCDDPAGLSYEAP